jgi:tetratricopeptide (TPR) repeat protein
MTEPSHVTVGMPVHDDPEGLLRSVPTVFGQTWDGEVRLLIVDDGSGPETVAVLERLSDRYDGIEIVRNERNRGGPHVRNQILERADDGYLAWIDAGGLWHPRKLELQIATLAGDDRESVICMVPVQRQTLDRAAVEVKAPDLEGDQLYNVLLDRIPAHLPAMLGRTSVFRNIGFDERLLACQDYDLLVRFLARGGRLVSTPDDLPLFTYVESDLGTSARDVAEANRVLRRKHGPIHARHGSALTRQVVGNQHRLVARLYANDGMPIRAVAHRVHALIADPAHVGAQFRGRVRRILHPLRHPVRATVRDGARRLRGFLPLLHRTGVVSMARRTGLVRLAARLGLLRTLYTELKGEDALPPSRRDLARWADVDPADGGSYPPELRAAHNLMLGGDHAEAIERIEEVVARGARQSAPGVWLLLEEAYRRGGRLHSAQRTLERGLREHPGERRLELRLAELHGLRRDWDRCVQRWFSLRAVAEDDLSPLSYARAARSLRVLGRERQALEVAEAGLRRWPDDARLAGERDKSRALAVEWGEAVCTTAPDPISRPGDPAGAITHLGFLAGGDGPIEGRVDLRAGGATKVGLLLNGREIAATTAVVEDDQGSVASFSLNCRDILEYIGDGDVVSMQSGGIPIAVPGGGTRLVFAPGHDSGSEELLRKLDAGHVFVKFGRLVAGNTPQRKHRILALFDEIAAIVERELTYPLFPFYGNLLGAIREHDFIAHDVGGFDTAYVSQHDQPEGVRAELLGLCTELAELDYHLELKPWSVYVRPAQGDDVFIDLNFAWFNPAGELNVSYGWRHPPVTDRDRLLMPRESPIHGHIVRVPGNAEAVLEQLYGPGWPVPVQGFEPAAGITRDDSYLLSRSEMEALEDRYPDLVRVRSVLTSDGEVISVG